MKTMSKALSASLLFAAPLPAMAQGMPVHDSANLIQQINAVRQALQLVAQGKQQISEAQRLYQDLNKITDIPRLAQELQSDALRQLDTSQGALEGFGNGNLDAVGAGRAKADAVYRNLLAKLGMAGSDQSRASFDLNARNIAINAGLADNIGAAVTSRTQGIEQLRTRLTTAATAKEDGDLTARLQLESVAMQNDQLRLQAIACSNRRRSASARRRDRLRSPRSSMRQAAITRDSDIAPGNAADRAAGCGVRHVGAPGRYARPDMAVLRRAPARDRSDADHLSPMVGGNRARRRGTRCRRDELPGGRLRARSATDRPVGA